MLHTKDLASRLRDGLQDDGMRQRVGISVIDDMQRDLDRPNKPVDGLLEDSSMAQILEGLPDFEQADVVAQDSEENPHDKARRS